VIFLDARNFDGANYCIYVRSKITDAESGSNLLFRSFAQWTTNK